MTEYDSGSSSDSGSDSGSSDSSSSSDASSGWAGFDVSPIVQSLIEDLTEPRPRDRSSTPSGPSEAERQRRAQFEETLKGILAAPSGPAVDERSLLRRIVEAERWFLPVEPDGSIVRLGTLDRRALHAFTRPLSADDPDDRRGRRTRAPSSVAAALATEPDGLARQLSGRELARAIPPDADGLLCVLTAETSFGLRREELSLLTQLADSLDLEQILVEPAPGQLQALRAARWYVPASNQKLRPSEPGWGPPKISIFTHPDRAWKELAPLVELDSQTLCTRLANRGDFVGIDVNPGRQVGIGGQQTHALVLGPNFARDVARGVDRRPGAEPLLARTMSELILWLDLDAFPWEGREILPVDGQHGQDAPAGTTLIQVRAKGPSTWRIYQTSYRQEQRRGPVLSPVFALARPDQLPTSLPAPVPPAFVTTYGRHLNPDTSALSAASIDLGEGQTQILCAGRLAKRLYDQDHWSPGGWFVSKLDRLIAARLAGWAHELLKLIPPGADKLPRSASSPSRAPSCSTAAPTSGAATGSSGSTSVTRGRRPAGSTSGDPIVGARRLSPARASWISKRDPSSLSGTATEARQHGLSRDPWTGVAG